MSLESSSVLQKHQEANKEPESVRKGEKYLNMTVSSLVVNQTFLDAYLKICF